MDNKLPSIIDFNAEDDYYSHYLNSTYEIERSVYDDNQGLQKNDGGREKQGSRDLLGNNLPHREVRPYPHGVSGGIQGRVLLRNDEQTEDIHRIPDADPRERMETQTGTDGKDGDSRRLDRRNEEYRPTPMGRHDEQHRYDSDKNSNRRDERDRRTNPARNGDAVYRTMKNNIIGNTSYIALRNKRYINASEEHIHILAERLTNENIRFSGLLREGGKNSTITVDGDNVQKLVKDYLNEITRPHREDEIVNPKEPINKEAIIKLRQIEPRRKSLHNIIAAEEPITKPFDDKMNAEMGNIAPVNRRVDDWRVSDERRVLIIEIESTKSTFKGFSTEANKRYQTDVVVYNKDTNMSIIVNSHGLKDTFAHATKYNTHSAINATYQIEQILENGVLLDVNISEKNNKNKKSTTALMHKFYGIYRYKGDLYLSKATVEEYLSGKSNIPVQRFYNLQDQKIDINRLNDIQKTLLNSVLADNSATVNTLNSVSVISVAQLREIVNTLDKNFFENKADLAILGRVRAPCLACHYEIPVTQYGVPVNKSEKTGKLIGYVQFHFSSVSASVFLYQSRGIRKFSSGIQSSTTAL